MFSFAKLSGDYKDILKSKSECEWKKDSPEWKNQMNSNLAVLRIRDKPREYLETFLCEFFTKHSEEESYRILADFYDKRNDPVFYEDAEKLKDCLKIGSTYPHFMITSRGMEEFFKKY